MPDEQSAVRFLDRDAGIITGLIVPFTGPLEGDKDLYGTRFSKDTDLALDWFPDGGRPGLYSHGHDEDLEMEVIGREIRSFSDDKGRWLEAQIDKSHRYAEEILKLVDDGMLSLSSGSIDHLVKINGSTRDVERWPWVEWSLVPNPGNPEALIYSVRSTDAIERQPELAIRVVADLDALVPEPEKPEPKPGHVFTTSSIDDLTTSVRSLLTSMKPEALHQLACDQGATCPPPAVSEDPEPGPVIAIRADDPEPVPMSDDDFAALRETSTATAIEKAHQVIS